MAIYYTLHIYSTCIVITIISILLFGYLLMLSIACAINMIITASVQSFVCNDSVLNLARL